MGLFSKASPGAIAGYLGSMALNEGAEEVIETLADRIADDAQNTIIGSLTGQRVDATELNAEDMANEFIMASVGAVLLGSPVALNISVHSKQTYNGMMEAKAHFESVLSSEISSPAEKELASKAIEVINYGLNSYESQTAVPGVEMPGDQVKPAKTYNQLMNELANAMQPDVKQELGTVMQTIEYADNVRNTLQETLLRRGMNIDASSFADMSPQMRNQYLNIAKELNKSGVSNLATRMMRGQNGASVNGGIVINTDQSTTLDINALADLDDAVAENAIKTGGDEIFKEAGADVSALASASHELAHYAEKSGKWGDLRNTIESMMGSERFNKAKTRIEQIYKSRGINDVNAEHELVAFFIQDNFGNTEFLRRLAGYNTSLFNRLLSKARAMLSGDSVTKLEDTFMGAIFESQRKLETQGTPAYSIGSVFQAVNISLEKVGNRFEAYVGGKKADSEDSLAKREMVSPNSFDENGNQKPLKRQLTEMADNPSAFGYANVAVGNTLGFAGVDDQVLFINNKGLKHLLNHIDTIDEASSIIESIPNNVFLATDYMDKSGSIRKNLFVNYANKPYLVSLEHSGFNKTGVETTTIERIINVFDRSKTLESFLDNAISLKRGNIRK